MKKVLKILLIVILAIVLALAGLILWLTVTEFKPEPVESIAVTNAGETEKLQADKELRIISWNIGYGGLGRESDFFMDGGKDVQSAGEHTVIKYLSGIHTSLLELEPDIIMLQEVDIDSKRTYHIDESFVMAFSSSAHALNYSCDFVPIPFPPMGKINSGVFTTTVGLEIDQAERISLPCPFKWPVSTANIKRCLLACYLPIEGSDKHLVMVNLHLEAYDSGEGKIAQTKMLKEFIEGEYAKGNYVVAGGDFNQVFPGSLDVYPNTHEDLWTPGVLEESMLDEGWRFAYDLSVPTCRLLNQPYDPSDLENTQYYVIDGFILSPNVELVDICSLDLGFENSDHNPVQVSVKLK